MVNKQSADRFLQILFLASIFLLALTEISDVDVWIHLSFGRLIWNLRGLPATEPFLYTMQGEPFSYSSWLFGLIYYAAYHLFNIYGVILLKASTITAVFYILLKDSLRPYRNAVVAVVILSLVVITTRYRFSERPETFMMVFLAFSIFSLNAFFYDGKKYLYALPVVHLLWANSHSSINLMVVPFLAFILGGILQRLLARKSGLFQEAPSVQQLKTIALVFGASFAASLVSPYFIHQYFFGAEMLRSDWFKQEIEELRAPTWETMKWPFLAAPAIFFSFIANRKRINLIPIFLVLPFIGLSFTAIRFGAVLSIVAGPVIARNLSAAVAQRDWWSRVSSRTAVYASALWIVLFATLTFAGIPPFNDPPEKFGFKINYQSYPEGALRYMDKRNITGRIFNIYEWGQYITWRDYPKRTAFVDGRGYLKEDLLESIDPELGGFSALEKLYRQYGFQSILLKYRNASLYAMSADSVLKHTGWALVYWDDDSLLYLKKGGPYDDVIREDEYRYVTQGEGISASLPLLANGDDRVRIIRELERNIRETGSSRAYVYLGQVYNALGRSEEAIAAFSHVARPGAGDYFLAHMYSGTGYAYERLGKFAEAQRSYQEAFAITHDPRLYVSMGALYIKMNQPDKAITCIEKALAQDNTIIQAYPLLISLYSQEKNADKAQQLTSRYQRLLLAARSKEHIKRGLEAYATGRYDIAAIEFTQSIADDPSNAEGYSNLGYVYLRNGNINEAYEYQRKAIAIDPKFALAYYGLALIYEKQGNAELAKKNMQEYERLESSGYLSRQAKRYINATGSR